MKYYLIEIATYTDGTKDSVGIYTYDTLDAAIANFHSKMGGAMKNEKYATELLKVINSDGGTHVTEKYVRVIEDAVTE